MLLTMCSADLCPCHSHVKLLCMCAGIHGCHAALHPRPVLHPLSAVHSSRHACQQLPTPPEEQGAAQLLAARHHQPSHHLQLMAMLPTDNTGRYMHCAVWARSSDGCCSACGMPRHIARGWDSGRDCACVPASMGWDRLSCRDTLQPYIHHTFYTRWVFKCWALLVYKCWQAARRSGWPAALCCVPAELHP